MRPVPSIPGPLGPSCSPTADRYQWMVETVSEVIFEADPAGNWTYLNPAWSRVLGHGVEESIGRNFLEFVHPDDRQGNLDIFVATVSGGKDRCRFEARYLTADGGHRHMEIHAWIFRGPDGVPQGSTGTLTDVTDRRRAEVELEHRATHDPLTSLPNRALLNATLSAAVVAARRAGTDVGVLFIDVDRFKLVNDCLGHDAGDALLIEVARRLERESRDGDTVARFGGDEFVVVCQGLDALALIEHAEALRTAVSEPFSVGQRSLNLTLSVGARSLGDVEGTAHSGAAAAQALLRDADAAMYGAKEAGRDRVAAFRPETRAQVVRRFDTERRLSLALERDEFLLHYQPQFNLADGSTLGVEALLRWADPERGLVAPGDFIEVAEETGLILPIGRWVCLEACRRLVEARDAGRALRISLNVSAHQLDLRLARDVAAALAETGAPAEGLCLEITESALISAEEAESPAVRSIYALAALGVRISLDDFGTGFSSLSYLQRLPLRELKIDRSFVNRLDRTDGYAIVSAIVRMADALGLETCAEGVERTVELSLLERTGCRAVQGFLLGRPVPWAELTWDRAMGGAQERVAT